MNLLQNAINALRQGALWQGGTLSPNLLTSHRGSIGFTLPPAIDTVAQKSKRVVGLVTSRGFTNGLHQTSIS